MFVKHYVGFTGPMGAEFMIVGEAPGEEEIKLGEPFVGGAGKVLDSILEMAEIDRSLCRIGNVSEQRPANNKIDNFFHVTKKAAKMTKAAEIFGRYPGPVLRAGLLELAAEINECKPKVILAVGGTAMWALTGVCTGIMQTSILRYRGSTLQLASDPEYFPTTHQCVVIPTLHPAFLMRGQWQHKPDVVVDCMRAKNALTEPPQKLEATDVWGIDLNETVSWLVQLYLKLENRPVMVSVDLETDEKNGLIVCCSLAYRDAKGEVRAICIPFYTPNNAANAHGEGSFWSPAEELKIWEFLRSVLTHKNCEIVGQYFFAFDWWMFVRWFGFKPNLKWDTYMMQHVCNPGGPKSLLYLSSLYCSFHRHWKDDRKGWNKGADNERKLWTYCNEDTIRTLEVAENLKDMLEFSELTEQYQFVLDSAYMSFDMSLSGVAIDHANRQRILDECKAYRTQLKKSINVMTGGESIFSDEIKAKGEVSSPKCAHFFYTVMGIRPLLHQKTRKPTANKEALPKLARKYPELAPLVQCIMEFRSLSTIINTFLSAGVDPDSRMRSVFNVAGTETFRWSSSTNPFGTGANLQNITEGGDR